MRLWWVPPKAVAAMRAPSLAGIIGSQVNMNEFRRLLEEVERVDLYGVSVQQSLHYHSSEHCLSRFGDGGDYVYYDPWSCSVINWAQYETLLMRGCRQMLPGDLFGYDFHIDMLGWNGLTYEPTTDDIAVAAKNSGRTLTSCGWTWN